MVRVLTGLLSVLLATLFLCGCMQRRIIAKTHSRTPQQKEYKKIENCRLLLEMVSRREVYYAGEDVQLRYRLRNLGEPVLISEWWMDESRNIRIYYYKLAKGENELNVKFDPARWKKIEPPPEKVIKRAPLHLSTDNMVFIEKPLPFIAAMKRITAGTERYLIVGELNLSSVSARTKPSCIIVK